MHRDFFPVCGAAAGAWVEQMMRRAGCAEHAARPLRCRKCTSRQRERRCIGARDQPRLAALARPDRALLAEIDEDMSQAL